jgi:hypothetical protein
MHCKQSVLVPILLWRSHFTLAFEDIMSRARAATLLNFALLVVVAVGLSVTSVEAQNASNGGAAITTGSLPAAVSPLSGDASKTTIAARAAQSLVRVRLIAALAEASSAVGEAKALANEAAHLGRRSQAALAAFERLSGKGDKYSADAAKYGAHVVQLDALLERIELKLRRSNSTLAQNK